MNETELTQWLADTKGKVDAQIAEIFKGGDPDLMPLWKKLIKLDNSLVEVFWEIITLKKKRGMNPPKFRVPKI